MSKADVSKVYYVRVKPASDSAAHAVQEMFVLDPELWPHFLHLGGKIAVPVYDSSVKR